jgi:hypothetical protein
MKTEGLYYLEIARWRVNHPDFEKKDIKMEFVISLCTDENILIELTESSDGSYVFSSPTTAKDILNERIQATNILCSEIVKIKPSIENEPILKQMREYIRLHECKWKQMLREKDKYLKLKLIELRKKELECDFE